MLGHQVGRRVLTHPKSQCGMSLVEIMIAVAIVSLLLAAAAPNFSSWMQNTRIRNATEAIQSGLHLAKNEAVRRNTTAKFIPCDASSWVVLASSAAAAAAGTSLCNGAIILTNGWEVVQTQPADSASNNVTLDFSQGAVAFNGLGRIISTTDDPVGTQTPAAVAVDLNLTADNAICTCPTGNCGYPNSVARATSGTARCLRIEISNSGSLHMCDPALPTNTPQGC